MNLYFLRHAIAVEKEEWRKPESERPLTDEGIRKMRRVAEGMRALKLSFDWILTSPARRAYDTAEIVAKEFKAGQKVRILKSLAPDGDPKILVKHLALNFRSWESVLLVGHEPYLSHLISMLLTGEPEPPFELKKGGLSLLSADSLTYGRCARLEWLIQPKQLKKIA